VGEALIMTALGLAVAIPAVLAYNTLVRSNRILLAELESFAQDLHILLTTGAPLAATDKPRQPAAVKGYGRLQGVIA
jgi:biopolymer transport protein ExbB